MVERPAKNGVSFNEIHEALSDTLQFELDFDDNEWYDVLKSFGMEVERK